MVDSDWAGCSLSRKSPSGGCLMWRGVCLKAWSTTQGAVALSSGEAEYYAAVKGASEGLGFQSACRQTAQRVQRNLPKNRIGEGKASGGCLPVASGLDSKRAHLAEKDP